MFSIDMRTVIFFAALIDVISLVIIALLWYQNRKHFAGILFWVVDYLMQVAAMLVLYLRGTVPELASIIASNTLLLGGTIILLMGLQRFVGRKGSQVHNWVLLAFVVVAITYFGAVQPSLWVRNIAISAGLFVLCFQCMWLVLRGVEPELRPITRGVGIAFGGLCIISLVRIVGEVVSPMGSNDFFRSGAFDAAMVVALQLFFILLTFTLIMMVNLRLVAGIRKAERAIKEYSQRLEQMVEERTRELKDAQEQLIRKERLAILGQLAGGIGHELRNPLGAIKNSAYFLNMVLEKPDPQVKETLEIVSEEVARCERIISTLLDFARQKAPSRRDTDVNRVFREALSRISVPQNVVIASQLDEALPTVLADSDQLRQVFENIILNAIQAMPAGGRLLAESRTPSAGWVAVSIADTGVGISPEKKPRLFEPLFTTKAKGVGLGLALTKMLVEAHGGTIRVESEVGKGSTFTVRLPVS